jgi:hypothetical protein
MRGPDEDDVVEQGGPPLRMPEWTPLPRWLPGLGGWLSRGAGLFGLATLIVGLAAGYALGDRHSGQPSRPASSSASASTPAAAVRLVPSAAPGPADSAHAPPTYGGPAYSAVPGADDLFGLAQTGERPNRHRATGGVP